MKNYSYLIIIFLVLGNSCQSQSSNPPSFISDQVKENKIFIEETFEETEAGKIAPILVGAEQSHLYLPNLADKKVGMLVNQTSTVGETHLVDYLIESEANITTIFAPEHGFRGTADAGEKIENGKDSKTGLPIISLYGNHKKPTPEDFAAVDIMIFDIQDVGARFYTYISTLHYVMEACAENNIPLIVLDRPNPNGHYIDGPVLEKAQQSFVGMHQIPIVHGMSIAEYAQMLNGEKWLTNGIQCDLSVVKCQNYDHNTPYELPIKPSPNLPNTQSINLYPSICFFEGTEISLGRGTTFPFQVMGNPTIDETMTDFSFTPVSTSGAKYPKHENKVCYGFDLRDEEQKSALDLSYLIMMYNLYPDKDNFFLENGFFNLLAGNTSLKQAIIDGKTEEEIKATWQEDLADFQSIRKQYLLYPDFE